MSRFLLRTGISYEEALLRFKSIKTLTQRAWLARLFAKITLRRRSRSPDLCVGVFQVLQAFDDRERLEDEELARSCSSVSSYPAVYSAMRKFTEVCKFAKGYPRIYNVKQSRLRRARGWYINSRNCTIIGNNGQGFYRGNKMSSEKALANCLSLVSGVLSADTLKNRVLKFVDEIDVEISPQTLGLKKENRGNIPHKILFRAKCPFCDQIGTIRDTYKGTEYDVCPMHVRNRRRTPQQSSKRWWKKRVFKEFGIKIPIFERTELFTKHNSTRLGFMYDRMKTHCTDKRFIACVLNSEICFTYNIAPNGKIGFSPKTENQNAFFFFPGKGKIVLPRGLLLKNPQQLYVDPTSIRW